MWLNYHSNIAVSRTFSKKLTHLVKKFVAFFELSLFEAALPYFNVTFSYTFIIV